MQARKVNLFVEATQGSLTQWQMALVACFAPDRVNETDGVSTVPCSVALFWSSAQLMTCQVCCMVLFVFGGCVSDIENTVLRFDVRCGAELCGWIGVEQVEPATWSFLAWTQ